MKFKTLLSSVAIFACASSANAADVIKHHKHHVKKPVHIAQIIVAPVMPVAPSSKWVGPYLGFETGTAITKIPKILADQNIDYTNTIIKPKDRPLAGLFAGYNFAIGPRTILGVEGNIDYHSIETVTDAIHTSHYKEHALADARLRIGFVHDRFMPYIASGLSLARGSSDKITASQRAANKKQTYLGWNIGGGIDYALAQNVFLRADYRFSKVKIKDAYGIRNANNTLWHLAVDATKQSNDLRLGVAYKF